MVEQLIEMGMPPRFNEGDSPMDIAALIIEFPYKNLNFTPLSKVQSLFIPPLSLRTDFVF